MLTCRGLWEFNYCNNSHHVFCNSRYLVYLFLLGTVSSAKNKLYEANGMYIFFCISHRRRLLF